MKYRELSKEDQKQFDKDFTKEFGKTMCTYGIGIAGAAIASTFIYFCFTWDYGWIPLVLGALTGRGIYKARKEAEKLQKARQRWRAEVADRKDRLARYEETLVAIDADDDVRCNMGYAYYNSKFKNNPSAMIQERKYVEKQIEQCKEDIAAAERTLKSFGG